MSQVGADGGLNQGGSRGDVRISQIRTPLEGEAGEFDGMLDVKV